MLHIYMLCFASGPLAIKIIVVLTNALCPRSLEKSLCERDVRGDIFFFSVFDFFSLLLCSMWFNVTWRPVGFWH